MGLFAGEKVCSKGIDVELAECSAGRLAVAGRLRSGVATAAFLSPGSDTDGAAAGVFFLFADSAAFSFVLASVATAFFDAAMR